MSPSSTLRNPNGLVRRHEDVLWALNDPSAIAALHLLRSEGTLTATTAADRLEIADDDSDNAPTVGTSRAVGGRQWELQACA